MNPDSIIRQYYDTGSLAYEVLMTHSRLVTQKALAIADRVRHLKPDRQFIAEAAMLHDIGMIRTNAPDIGCFGDAHYLCHGVIGREMVEAAGYPRQALVCERHTGVGISRANIAAHNLPLPDRDLIPVSLEEKIICVADKFFSKSPANLRRERSLAQVRKSILKFGEQNLKTLDEWLAMFGFDSHPEG